MDFGAHFLGSVANETGLRGGSRSGFNGEDCLSRNLKLSRTEQEQARQEQEQLAASSSSSFGLGGGYNNKTMSFHQGIPLMRSTPLLPSDSRRQEHMLSFSDRPEAVASTPLDFTRFVGLEQHKNNNSLSLLPPPSSYLRTSGGYGSAGGMMMNMQGRGPFSMTQWNELEQQALIFKYIAANIPVPPSLLHSIKKSFYPYGSLPPSSFGWGGFHLGFAGGTMDPEPGRCRRTDGKKWRCSRDAVPDQKYCERHINRGRHRSRKPVEVPGQTIVASTAVGASGGSKAVLTPQQSIVAGGSNRRNARVSSSNGGLSIGDQFVNPSSDTLLNNRVRNPVYPSMVDLQPKETTIVQQKQENNDDNPFEFGHISSDSLLNPNTAKSYGSSSYLDFSNKPSSNHNPNPWSEEMNPEWTQLSMSIPIASSSSSSPLFTQEKITLSPLRLSREFNHSFQTEKETLQPTVKKENTWIPISWGNSGGPLGEVLNSTTNSPTGVLQKTTFGTLSNNSSVSSPNTDNNNNRNNNGEYFHYTTRS